VYLLILRLGLLPDSCGSPLYPVPAGGLRLPAGKHRSILTEFQTIVKKKRKKYSPQRSLRTQRVFLPRRHEENKIMTKKLQKNPRFLRNIREIRF
jgi:hypothetical protein